MAANRYILQSPGTYRFFFEQDTAEQALAWCFIGSVAAAGQTRRPPAHDVRKHIAPNGSYFQSPRDQPLDAPVPLVIPTEAAHENEMMPPVITE